MVEPTDVERKLAVMLAASESGAPAGLAAPEASSLEDVQYHVASDADC